jgi:hypothetical protein
MAASLLVEQHAGRAALVWRTDDGDRLLGTVDARYRLVFEMAEMLFAAGVKSDRWLEVVRAGIASIGSPRT